MSPTLKHARSTGQATDARRYAISDQFEVTPVPGCRGSLQIWCPVIADSPYQRVLNIAMAAPQPWRITRDSEFGNLMFHGEYTAPTPEALSFTIDYLVERLPISGPVDASRALPLKDPRLFARSLQPEQYVEVNDKTLALANEIVTHETNSLRQARRIYDYVTGTMSYNSAQQSWKGSTEHALACSVGNCNDIHALFVSLCRSIGIPARFVLGQALEVPKPGQESCDLCGYHCWAEFFIAGLGWLPADASCACKYGTHGLFGDLDMNHIAWSVGRDVLFAPPQRAGRSLFFAGPYAEHDGRPHPVSRHVGYSALGATCIDSSAA